MQNKHTITKIFILQFFFLLCVKLIAHFSEINTFEDKNAILIFLKITVYLVFLILIIRFIQKEKVDKTLLGLQLSNRNLSKGIIPLIFILFYLISLSNFNSIISISTIWVIIYMIPVAIVEEIVFRSFFKYVFNGRSLFSYVLLSSLIFSIFHISFSVDFANSLFVVMNTFLLGIIFALLLIDKGSIYPSILFHALYNIISSFSILVSEQLIFLFLLYLLNIGYLLYRIKSK